MTIKQVDYADLIGVPFVYGGRDTNGLDCYGLVMLMYARRGINIPDLHSPEVLVEIAELAEDEKFRWTCFAERTETELVPFIELQPGRALLLRVKGLACHVGYIHKPRRFLHTWEDSSGVAEERIELWRQRILGVYGYT